MTRKPLRFKQDKVSRASFSGSVVKVKSKCNNQMVSILTLCSRRSKPKNEITQEEAVTFLKKTPFHQYLSSESIEQFARCFLQVKRSDSGSRIELDSQRIYIVAEGEVDLSTTYPDGDAKVEATGYLCRKREGDIINLNQTKEDARKKATESSAHKINDLMEEIIVTACGKTETILLCADMNEVDSFTSGHPELSTVVASIISTQIEDKLLQIPFLQPVPSSKVSVLAAMCRYEAFDSNQTVFEHDDKADKLYLILNGVAQVIAREAPTSRGLHAISSRKQIFSEQTVALQRSLECSCTRQTLLQSSDIVIAELTSGDYFGETALVLNMDRTCKVRTTEKCLVLTVDKVDFKNFLTICPIQDMMKNVIKQRLLSKLSSLGIPFLSGFTEEMFTSLTDSVEIMEVPEDHVIFSEGDVGDKFYIVVHGSVEVTTNTETEGDDNEDRSSTDDGNESTLGTLGPGQYFGEMSLVNADNNQRTATVTSTQKSILLSIEKERFHELFGSNSQISAEFELRVLKNRAQLCHVLKHTLGLTSFRDFLEKEHAGENIDFWLAATNFAAEFSQLSEKERHAKSKQIFVTFCAEYADRQINLPHNLMNELDDRIHKKDKISSEIFNAAISEIYKLMEKDNFSRYKTSQEFKDYFGRLGIL